jgi:hypothetical protein
MSVAKRLWKALKAELGSRGHGPSPRGGSSDVEWGRGVEPGSTTTATGVPPVDAPPVDAPPVDAPSINASHVDVVLAGYYANLEVPYGADLAAVEAAWKRLLRRTHPDRHANSAEVSDLATALTKKLNHAYTQLCRHLATESTVSE